MVLVFDNIKVTSQDTTDPHSVVTVGHLQNVTLQSTQGSTGPQ